MNEYDIHEMLLKNVCKEIATIADQIQKNGSMTDKDLERLDKLYHTKKDMLACWGMEHPDEFDGYSGSMGNSGYRGRAANGRYVSRDGGSFEEGYNSGYDKGYSNAMAQGGNSGHWPMPYYPDQRRW